MPTGAKGKNVYQGSLAVQQSLVVKSGGVGHAGGEPSTSQIGEIGDRSITSEYPPAEELENDDSSVAPPTLPPPTPSPSKRRFSAVSESADASSSSAIVDSSSAGISRISPVSRSAVSSSSSRAKRGKMTGAIAMSSLGHELSDIKGLLRLDLELTKSNAEAREERKRQQLKRWQEREHLDRERLEHEHLEERKRLEQSVSVHQDPMLDAIYHMQEVETDLSADEQAILVDLFSKEHDSAKSYLALKSDPVRKAWIKRRLKQADSG